MQGSKSGLAKIFTKAVEEIASYAKITTEDEESQILYPPITLENYISTDIATTEEKLKSLGDSL